MSENVDGSLYTMVNRKLRLTDAIESSLDLRADAVVVQNLYCRYINYKSIEKD